MARAPLIFASLSALSLAVLMAAPAIADPAGAPAASGQVVAAAPAGASAPPSETSPAAAPARVAQPFDDDDEDGPALPDNKIHGEMGVGFGTGGYREIYGAATAPLPDGGQATVAVDVGQIGPIRR